MQRPSARLRDALSPEDERAPNVLWQSQHAFEEQVAWGKILLQSLERDGIRNTAIRRSGGAWLLWAKLPDKLQQRFGLAPEVLLLVVPQGEVEASDLERARGEIVTAGLRLDSDVLTVVDAKPKLFNRLRGLHRWGQWVPWQPEFRTDLFYVFRPLSEQFQRCLPEYDIFEARDPVRGHQVIGRKDAIFELSKRLTDGKSVGVFGLRKVGKTTLVRAVTDILDPMSAALSISAQEDRHRLSVGAEPRILAAWLDCQRIITRTRDAVARLILKELGKRLPAVRAALPVDSEDPFEEIALFLERAAEAYISPVCIVLDEYDLLFEGGGAGAIPGLEQLFGLFRAHSQATGKLSLVVIGRDPEFFQSPRMNGVTNPMLSWFTPHWVGPLDRRGADELLDTLGRRVGLDVGPKTKDAAYFWTGGHPLLHRQYGSVLLDLARKSKALKESIPTDPLCDAAIEPFLERDPVIEICREVYDLLLSRYSDAAELIEELATEPKSESPDVLELYGGFYGSAAKTLRDFGLLTGTAAEPSVPEVIRWYTKTKHPRPV